jgi:hypothetical protein
MDAMKITTTAEVENPIGSLHCYGYSWTILLTPNEFGVVISRFTACPVSWFIVSHMVFLVVILIRDSPVLFVNAFPSTVIAIRSPALNTGVSCKTLKD